MGRKILLVTTDQQRYDTLGCNGGTLARTPVVDGLAADGIRYERAIPQSVVCMPSRSTILTGQHPTTHGVWMNGVPLPVDAPSVAEPSSTTPATAPRSSARRTSSRTSTRSCASPRTRSRAPAPRRRGGTHRGFEHLEFATHGADGPAALRAAGCRPSTPRRSAMFYAVLDARPAGERAPAAATPARRRCRSTPIPREWYHTDWVADRTIAWLDSLDADDDWFCWMSFPDPHHPWDPPQSEVGRVDWRDVPLPAGYPESAAEREAILDAKPRHWRLWYDGTLVSNYEAPAEWVPATLTADQVREVNARNAVECELIDEALGRVLACDRGPRLGRRRRRRVHHRPRRAAGRLRAAVQGPVPRRRADAAAADLAAGAQRGRRAVGRHHARRARRPRARRSARSPASTPPEWMQGAALPVDDADDAAAPSACSPSGTASCSASTCTCARSPATAGCAPPTAPGTVHDGTEGELYDLVDDPLQQHNRWDDPSRSARCATTCSPTCGTASRSPHRAEARSSQAPGVTWRYEDGGPRRTQTVAGRAPASGRATRLEVTTRTAPGRHHGRRPRCRRAVPAPPHRGRRRGRVGRAHRPAHARAARRSPPSSPGGPVLARRHRRARQRVALRRVRQPRPPARRRPAASLASRTLPRERPYNSFVAAPRRSPRHQGLRRVPARASPVAPGRPRAVRAARARARRPRDRRPPRAPRAVDRPPLGRRRRHLRRRRHEPAARPVGRRRR